MKKVIFLFAINLFITEARSELPKVDFFKGHHRIEVTIGGKPFTSYHFGGELTKPVLAPVCTPSGIEVSRRVPLVEMEGGSMDHEHHVGIFFAVDKVNGINFWRNAATPPQIRHAEITQMTGGAGRGQLSAVSHWIDDKEQVLLEEKRTMVFFAGEHEDEYAIDFNIDLTAKDKEIIFEDIEEGMFAIRLSDYLRESDAGVVKQTGGPIPKENVSGTGRYFSSNGDETAKNVWGKRARWVALQGVRKDKIVGIAILNHPASINYPTYWHVRGYGLFSANPLGQGDFQRQRPKSYRKNKVIPLRLTLDPGETVHFRFLVIVYEGIRTREQIEERFREFVKIE
ncbi:MAG: PmoA family protein [Sedimentisphaerales bacterium]|nr:PmoA family protein [Sedimentisphaerales bacterium]